MDGTVVPSMHCMTGIRTECRNCSPMTEEASGKAVFMPIRCGTGNSGLAPYRDETRNVLFSALTDGYSTEVFYVIADNDLSAKPETLFGAQYIDTGDDQPGEWKVTEGPADQELYDLFRAFYGDKPDFDSCRIQFYDAVENMDDYWWNTFIHTY